MPMWPAKLAYHVCEWTRSAPTQSPAIRQVDAHGLQGGVRVGEVRQVGIPVGAVLVAGIPKHRTRVSTSPRSRRARTSSATWTPAPP